MKILSFVLKLALALALIVALLGIAMYFAGYDFYAKVDKTTIYDSAGGYKVSTTDPLTVELGYSMFSGNSEGVEGYSVMVVPNPIAGKDFNFVYGGTPYSYQAEKDLTKGFYIDYGETEFKIAPKGDFKEIIKLSKGGQGNVEVDKNDFYANMYTIIIYSQDGEDSVKIHISNLEDGYVGGNNSNTDDSNDDSDGGTTDSGSDNNDNTGGDSGGSTGGNSGGSTGGSSGGNSGGNTGGSTKPWPLPGGFDIV